MTMFLGRAVIHIIDGIFGVLIGFTWGVTLLGLDLSNTDPWALLLVITVTTFSTSGLGLLLGSLSLVTRNVMFINNTAYFVLLVLSGSNIAIDRLPSALQAVSNVLPLTRGIASARAIIEGATFRDVRPAMLEEIGIGIIYIACGYMLFRWIEVLAKRRGTLEVM
jgi:ABC-2 type transport system permease protein